MRFLGRGWVDVLVGSPGDVARLAGKDDNASTNFVDLVSLL